VLWACVRLPQLALDGVLRQHPSPELPLVLLSGPPQRRRLFDANPAARAAGLFPGQALAGAQVLLTQFAAIDHDPAQESRLLDLLCAWAYRYSGMVARLGTQSLLLEVEASLGLFGPWPAFARRLRNDLNDLGFAHRLALAADARAAWVLAGVQDGLALTHRESQQRALAQVDVEHAELDPSIAEALSGMGMRRLGQLFALPRAALARRFGPGLLTHLDALRGLVPDPLPLYVPPDRFEARIELAYDVELVEALLFPLRRLTADLAAYLAGRDGGVQRFQLQFEHDGQRNTVLEIGLLAPERDPALLFDLARSRLERAPMPAAVRGLRLLAEQLPPFVPAGRDLFDERPAQAMPWPALRERLRARLGEDTVQTLHAVAEHRPEYATRTSSVSVPEAGEGARAQLARSAVAAERPAWLLPRAIPLRGLPPQLLAGPERIESGWWDGADVRRDYYIAQTSNGQRAWIYCAPGEVGPWMLHGWFA